MMDDYKEAISWDENEVRIEDLDVPDKGLSFFLFSFGKKLPALTRARTRLVAYVFTTCLLAIFLPGSALMRPMTQTPHTVSSASPQNKVCPPTIIEIEIDQTGRIWAIHDIHYDQSNPPRSSVCNDSQIYYYVGPGSSGSMKP